MSETLFAATVEALEVDIYTDADPTGASPQFALSAKGASAPGTFSAGSWTTSYASTGWTTARTPTLGSAGTLVIVSGTTYDVWAKVTLGSETAVWPVGTVVCP
jgi:hypothetical protein